MESVNCLDLICCYVRSLFRSWRLDGYIYCIWTLRQRHRCGYITRAVRLGLQEVPSFVQKLSHQNLDALQHPILALIFIDQDDFILHVLSFYFFDCLNYIAMEPRSVVVTVDVSIFARWTRGLRKFGQHLKHGPFFRNRPGVSTAEVHVKGPFTTCSVDEQLYSFAGLVLSPNFARNVVDRYIDIVHLHDNIVWSDLATKIGRRPWHRPVYNAATRISQCLGLLYQQ